MHGSAVVSQQIRDSKLLNSMFDVDYVNLSTSRKISEIGDNGLFINLKKCLRFAGIVHKRMEYTHFFTGGLVGGNRSVKPVCRYPFEFHVPCKSGDEVYAVLTVCGPVHEVVGAEVGVAPDYYLSVFPLFAELEYQPLEKSCNVDRLVSPARPEDGKDELSAAAFEQKQGHIAVFPVIGVEQRELLRAVGVGVRVIGIDDDGIWLRVIRGDEVIDEGLSDIEQFLAGQAVLQMCHRRLGSKVNLVRSGPAGTHLQDTVTTEPVAIVGIFEAAIIWYILWRSISVWLCITIGSQRGFLIQDSMRSMMRLDDFSYSRTSVNPPSEESSGAEKPTVTFLPATGSSSNNVGKVW